MNNLPNGYSEFVSSVLQHLMDRDYKIIKSICIPVFNEMVDVDVDVCEVLGGRDDGFVFGKVKGKNVALVLEKKQYE